MVDENPCFCPRFLWGFVHERGWLPQPLRRVLHAPCMLGEPLAQINTYTQCSRSVVYYSVTPGTPFFLAIIAVQDELEFDTQGRAPPGSRGG